MIIHTKNYGDIDTDTASDSELNDMIALLKNDIAAIDLQIELSQANRAQGLEGLSPAQYHNIRRARLYKTTHINNIQMELRHRKERRKEENRQAQVPAEITVAKMQAKAARARSVERAFVDIASEYLEDDLFREIMRQANMDVEARTGGLP